MDNGKQTLGGTIASLRKKHGMTQSDLAGLMNVTDKAVSKWERDLSCPDITSMPRLGEILGVSVNELLSANSAAEHSEKKFRMKEADKIIDGALSGIVVAMGVTILVQKVMNDFGILSFMPEDAVIFFGIGLFCTGLWMLRRM